MDTLMDTPTLVSTLRKNGALPKTIAGGRLRLRVTEQRDVPHLSKNSLTVPARTAIMWVEKGKSMMINVECWANSSLHIASFWCGRDQKNNFMALLDGTAREAVVKGGLPGLQNVLRPVWFRRLLEQQGKATEDERQGEWLVMDTGLTWDQTPELQKLLGITEPIRPEQETKGWNPLTLQLNHRLFPVRSLPAQLFTYKWRRDGCPAACLATGQLLSMDHEPVEMTGTVRLLVRQTHIHSD